ncbi:MAG: TraR/DksA C4-type zinc finger protein [Actinobacteria bacterium]|nr:TraR/DksA C4-type zinc finger protein [Actinomycetota bacterium]MBW3646678.1 TraR/DksA C4-type zinc finger protein [Actinomycetota bacterium]
MDTQDARQQLEQMLREIDSASAVLEAEGAGESSELSHLDQHPAETASEVTDAAEQAALLESFADRKAQVVGALARLDDGTYGVCVDCGQPIADARLEVRPEAARCLADQEKAEAAAT